MYQFDPTWLGPVGKMGLPRNWQAKTDAEEWRTMTRDEETSEQPFYYWYFHRQGRALLAHEFGDPHPFTRSGDKIVERVPEAGYRPVLNRVEREAYSTADAVSVVEHDGRHFFVYIESIAGTETVRLPSDFSPVRL